ncbi:hypothetical protein [Streptomyces sp. NPDC002250]|uniref:hypothetical protein n=1 Tax=Streptomyces sp. NPDC002250 TaxID=3364641 RepID=UPI0036BB179C
MLRNLDVEFRGNGLRDELHSRLVRNGAVTHMENMCGSAPADARIAAPSLGGPGALGARVLGGPDPPATAPEQPVPSSPEPRTPPEEHPSRRGL